MTDGIILAGGYSSRLGKNKMGVLYKNIPVILHTIKHMQSVCENIYVVTGFYHDQIVRLVKDLDDIHLVYNHDYAKGMFTSIKMGVECVENNFFIIPGDCPMVNEEVYRSIMLGTKGIRVPSVFFKLGHPIYFDISYKEKILSSKLDSLKAFRNQFDYEIIPVNEAGILFDIDTLADVELLKEKE